MFIIAWIQQKAPENHSNAFPVGNFQSRPWKSSEAFFSSELSHVSNAMVIRLTPASRWSDLPVHQLHRKSDQSILWTMPPPIDWSTHWRHCRNLPAHSPIDNFCPNKSDGLSQTPPAMSSHCCSRTVQKANTFHIRFIPFHIGQSKSKRTMREITL